MPPVQRGPRQHDPTWNGDERHAPVHVEDLLALDREQSREDTFGQAGAEDDLERADTR